LLNHQMWLFRG